MNAGVRRNFFGVALMAGVCLLQLGTEYLATHDEARLLAKSLALLVGLPLVAMAAPALFRRAAGTGAAPALYVLLGAASAGVLFAGLLSLTRRIGLEHPALLPHSGAWGATDVLRIGFAQGITTFALWALAFLFPFAALDAHARAMEAEKLRTQAELARLRSQLEPHFLLNSLNAVAGLVGEQPREARKLLAALGDLLRDALKTGPELEPLGEQIDWLRRYAEVLEARHAGHLVFNWDVEEASRQVRLPSLLLQPLVENAVKHGALKRSGGGKVTVRAQVGSSTLTCTVEDNGPGIPKEPTRPGAFGIESVRRRLALEYHDAAHFRLESSPNGTRSIVEVPLREAGAP
ncbi:MAG TPA: histidine kinase [Myxococcaceae bacterium]|nr:histidine kinase [Myxococcaceae bacterium]